MDDREFADFQQYCWQNPMKIWFSLTYCGEGWAANVHAAEKAILTCFPGAKFAPWRQDEQDSCTIHRDAWAITEAFPGGAFLASISMNVGEAAP